LILIAYQDLDSDTWHHLF